MLGLSFNAQTAYAQLGSQQVFLPFVDVGPAVIPAPEPPPQPGLGTSGNVQITGFFYNGAGRSEPDEYVTIQNMDGRIMQVQGWRLTDAKHHVFSFPAFEMALGQSCRVYTNVDDPAT